ncbi:MAG TPA: pentapeptide repeat-containing protein [Phycisphaerae bacterium]|nr:pentapeptide repeat-containing protein [Phycisphaerae bacterium]
MIRLGARIACIGLSLSTTGYASIIRWDNHATIPGTQNVTPIPHVNLSNWNTSSHNLQYALFNTDISSANFLNSDLRRTRFDTGANITGATFTNANILGAHFNYLTSQGFTGAQLASSASYTSQNLTGITFVGDELANWNFSRQNLSFVNFSAADLSNADLSNATIANTTFNGATGLSFFQFRSTASFAQRNLANSRLNRENLSGWNFSHQNLTNSSLFAANLTNAYFIQTNITGVNFDASTLTRDQLAATANYRNKTLNNLTLTNLDLSNVKLNAQNLSNDNFANSVLLNGNLVGANLFKANLTNADLAHSTLTNANLTNANLSDADLRGATRFLPAASTITANTIRPNGVIRNLSLKANERLTIHNDAIPVTAVGTALFNATSTLQFILSANWTSPLRFAPGLNPTLAGTLDLEFPASIDPSIFAGQSFRIFEWNTPPTGSNAFPMILGDPRVSFDTTTIYTTGFVTVLASGSVGPPTPEPASLSLLTLGAAPLLKRRR